MKKIRLVCIMLGVLILVGAMSGVALAQAAEEPQNVQTITFGEFLKSPESFVGKEIELTSGAVFRIQKTGPYSAYGAFLTVTTPRLAIALQDEAWRGTTLSSKGPRFSIVHLPLSLSTSKEGKEVEIWKIVTVKGVVKALTEKEIEKLLYMYIIPTSDEIIKMRVHDEFVKAFPLFRQADLAKKIQKIYYWIEVSEIKVTGRLPFLLHEQNEVSPQECKTLWWYDNEYYYCQQKEFCGLYMYEGLHVFKTKAECEEALRQTLPDYENFPHKMGSTIDKDNDGNIDLMQKGFVRDVKQEELKNQQKIQLTIYDTITLLKFPSLDVELLNWIPEFSLTVDTKTGLPDFSDLDYESLLSSARYAIKENGEWKFVNLQAYQEKFEQSLKDIGYTEEEIKEQEEQSRQLFK